jgi:large subunit ribosomal protein L10
LNRDEKATVVEELSGKLASAKFAVLTDYRGLTVPAMEELRRKLKDSNAELRVAKNTLLKRAIKDTSFESLEAFLEGTTALTITAADPVAPAKIIVEFAKTNPKLSVKSAVLDGKALTSDDVTALSRLPGKDELRAKLLGTMMAVPTGFVRVLNGIPQKVVYLLQAIKDKKEQGDN